MDWWLIVIFVGGMMLLALRLWAGPANGSNADFSHDDGSIFEDVHEPEPWEPEPWEAEALARYGTETSIEQLVSEGRADELRGLGYKGELPGE